MARFAVLTLAAYNKRREPIEGGTATAVNPEHVARITPVVVAHDDAGFPTGGVTQIEMSSGRRVLVRGTSKEIRDALKRA